MKKCPSCNRSFSDDTLSFCLEDGVLLSPAYDLDETVAMSEIPTATQVNRNTGHNDFDQPRNSNQAVTYLLVALIALLLGGGIVALMLYRNNSSDLSETASNVQTKSTSAQRPTPTLKFTVHDALRTYDYEQGWSGGKVNSEYSPNISYYPVTNSSVNGDDAVMYYAWKDGVLRLTISGKDLKGTWHQSNGNGSISLVFTDDFQSAKGTWSDPNSGESGVAILRRRR